VGALHLRVNKDKALAVKSRVLCQWFDRIILLNLITIVIETPMSPLYIHEHLPEHIFQYNVYLVK